MTVLYTNKQKFEIFSKQNLQSVKWWLFICVVTFTTQMQPIEQRFELTVCSGEQIH